MAYRKPHNARLNALPGRQWLGRASLALLLTVSLSLLVMGKAGNPAVSRMRANVADALAPVLAVAAAPFDAISSAGRWVGEMSSLRADNLALKNQNLQLLQWQASAKAMEQENQSLRALLAAVPERKNNFVTARIVSDLGGPYVHSALILGGGAHGIGADQAVIADGGLLGRVVEAGESSARVLLLNDINSRVPVIAERSREKAILTGTNKALPSLSYLAAGSRVEIGDRIVTSGDGGVFPPGVPVGVVTSIDSGGIVVQPFADPARVDYVSVVDPLR